MERIKRDNYFSIYEPMTEFTLSQNFQKSFKECEKKLDEILNSNNYSPGSILNETEIDEVIIFKPLSKETVYEVLDKIILEIESRLSDKNIKIKLTGPAKDYLVDIGYDVNYGARPLKRVVSRTIENMIAEKIIMGEIKYGDTVTFDYDDELKIKNS